MVATMYHEDSVNHTPCRTHTPSRPLEVASCSCEWVLSTGTLQIRGIRASLGLICGHYHLAQLWAKALNAASMPMCSGLTEPFSFMPMYLLSLPSGSICLSVLPWALSLFLAHHLLSSDPTETQMPWLFTLFIPPALHPIPSSVSAPWVLLRLDMVCADYLRMPPIAEPLNPSS